MLRALKIVTTALGLVTFSWKRRKEGHITVHLLIPPKKWKYLTWFYEQDEYGGLPIHCFGLGPLIQVYVDYHSKGVW